MAFSTRQSPDEPAVNRSEHQFACLGALAGTRHVVKYPFDFGRAEISIEDKACLLADKVGFSLAFQFVAVFGGTAVLPYDGIVDGFFRILVPDDSRFSLVGDADTGNVQSVDVDLCNSFGNDGGL